ncbi:MAG TPA: histidinol-phosphatase [Cyclobacteriaceae bacterium]|nr:histidinol-phosphatase [Cyclobacteriaceae bacterium]
MWTNYHTHSSFCDGKSEMSEIINKAKELNISSLGFSSHAPLPFECKWCMKTDALDSYIETIDRLNEATTEIKLYKGLEVDFIPNVINAGQFKDKLDYTIGSVHFVEKFDDGRGWEVDSTHQSFLEGLDQIFGNNIKDAVARYFELTREMIRTSPPDIIGHVDKIKIQNIGEKFFRESDQWYKDEISKTIDVIAASHCIIEVNTRGLYQKKSETPYPSPWILELLLKKNIPITLNSDAHHADDLTGHFTQTAKTIYRLGFKTISVLREGKWKQAYFDEHGIT